MSRQSADDQARTPNPSVDVTKTLQHIRVKDPGLLNPYELMVAHNLEVNTIMTQKVMAQNDAIFKQQAEILKKLGGGRSRKGSASSRTSVSTEAASRGGSRDDALVVADDEVEGEEEGEDTTGLNIEDDGENVCDPYMGLIREAYGEFIASKKKTAYQKKIPAAIKDAALFKAYMLDPYLPTTLGDEGMTDHPLPDILEGLDKEALVDMYIQLGKEYRMSKPTKANPKTTTSDKGKGKGKAAGTSTSTGPVSEARRASKDVSPPRRSAMRRSGEGSSITKKRALTTTQSGRTAIEGMISAPSTPHPKRKRNVVTSDDEDEDEYEDEDADDDEGVRNEPRPKRRRTHIIRDDHGEDEGEGEGEVEESTGGAGGQQGADMTEE